MPLHIIATVWVRRTRRERAMTQTETTFFANTHLDDYMVGKVHNQLCLIPLDTATLTIFRQ